MEKLIAIYIAVAVVQLLITGVWSGVTSTPNEARNHWDPVGVSLLWPAVWLYVVAFIVGALAMAGGRMVWDALARRHAA